MASTRAPAARPSHTHRPASPGGRIRRWRGSPPLTLLAVALGVMMVGLDGTIVAVANPAIQSHLHASLAGIQWISNAYLLALAVSLIAAGKAGDRFGHKKVFLTGIVGFGLTSAAIGLSGDIAHSIALMIAFRVLQGVFGAPSPADVVVPFLAGRQRSRELARTGRLRAGAVVDHLDGGIAGFRATGNRVVRRDRCGIRLGYAGGSGDPCRDIGVCGGETGRGCSDRGSMCLGLGLAVCGQD